MLMLAKRINMKEQYIYPEAEVIQMETSASTLQEMSMGGELAPPLDPLELIPNDGFLVL